MRPRADAKVNATRTTRTSKCLVAIGRRRRAGCCTRGDKVKEVTLNETKALDQTELARAPLAHALGPRTEVTK